jgi:hypothetical protein
LLLFIHHQRGIFPPFSVSFNIDIKFNYGFLSPALAPWFFGSDLFAIQFSSQFTAKSMTKNAVEMERGRILGNIINCNDNEQFRPEVGTEESRKNSFVTCGFKEIEFRQRKSNLLTIKRLFK